MKSTVFNPSQQHILRMLSFSSSESTVDELKRVLFDYYSKRMQTEADKLWDEGVLDDERIEGLLDEHLRTPYKK